MLAISRRRSFFVHIQLRMQERLLLWQYTKALANLCVSLALPLCVNMVINCFWVILDQEWLVHVAGCCHLLFPLAMQHCRCSFSPGLNMCLFWLVYLRVAWKCALEIYLRYVLSLMHLFAGVPRCWYLKFISVPNVSEVGIYFYLCNYCPVNLVSNNLLALGCCCNGFVQCRCCL